MTPIFFSLISLIRLLGRHVSGSAAAKPNGKIVTEQFNLIGGQHMKQENCVFCKIINHEIPSAKVYEDENILAFLDISQVTEGHTLVIPKKHCKDIFELDEQTLAQVFQAVKKIAGKMQENLEVDGINLVNNNGKNAGQEVFHYHVHFTTNCRKNKS